MRIDRLRSDFVKMSELSAASHLIDIACDGNPPERYTVTYKCKGMIWQPGSPSPSVSAHHQLSIYLHHSYPRLPPALKWLTPIFHPNILSPDKNGGVCIGCWSPSETLADLCVRIGEMVQYKNYNDKDPLDLAAAEWVALNRQLLPVDNRNF